MKFNAEYTGEKYRDIAHAFGMKDSYDVALEEARTYAVDAVKQLVEDLGNPTTISAVGVDESGLDALAEDAFNDVCTPGNPRKATKEEIRALYASLL